MVTAVQRDPLAHKQLEPVTAKEKEYHEIWSDGAVPMPEDYPIEDDTAYTEDTGYLDDGDGSDNPNIWSSGLLAKLDTWRKSRIGEGDLIERGVDVDKMAEFIPPTATLSGVRWWKVQDIRDWFDN